MKDITYYIEKELFISEFMIQSDSGNPIDYMTNDDTLKEFLIICKYADFFNSIEQHWHEINKSTPRSRAIKDQTDKLFKIGIKTVSMVTQSSDFDFEGNLTKGIMYYYDDKFYIGKKLNTIIKRSEEWKEFYKSFKKFKDSEVSVEGHDSQLVNLMKQFVIISKDFVEDVQS